MQMAAEWACIGLCGVEWLKNGQELEGLTGGKIGEHQRRSDALCRGKGGQVGRGEELGRNGGGIDRERQGRCGQGKTGKDRQKRRGRSRDRRKGRGQGRRGKGYKCIYNI